MTEERQDRRSRDNPESGTPRLVLRQSCGVVNVSGVQSPVPHWIFPRRSNSGTTPSRQVYTEGSPESSVSQVVPPYPGEAPSSRERDHSSLQRSWLSGPRCPSSESVVPGPVRGRTPTGPEGSVEVRTVLVPPSTPTLCVDDYLFLRECPLTPSFPLERTFRSDLHRPPPITLLLSLFRLTRSHYWSRTDGPQGSQRSRRDRVCRR